MIIEECKGQLSLLAALGYHFHSEYLCPFCKRYISDPAQISREDAPQDALGGKKLALTCKDCNNTYGHTIDCHLINFITDSEDRLRPAGMNRRFVFHDKERGHEFRGQLEVLPGGEMRMVLPKQINDPTILGAEIHDLSVNDVVIAEMATNKEKRIPQNIAAAMLKNAYVILFSDFGYSFLMDAFYDRIRAQINNPSQAIIPEGLISREGVFDNYPDGVYACETPPLRGFLVLFTVKKRDEHKYSVFIPVKSNGLDESADCLRSIKGGSLLKARRVQASSDYWNNPDTIQSVIAWTESTELEWK